MHFAREYVSCGKETEDIPELEQSVSVLNEIGWNDIAPILLVKGENIVFDATVGAEDVLFAGASGI